MALYKKSNYIWALPDLELGLPAPNNPNFILTSDKRHPPEFLRGGCGPWDSSLYPVKALTAPRFTEALILLWCRDYGTTSNYAGFWDVSLGYMAEYVYDRGFIKSEDIDPKFLPVLQTSCLKWDGPTGKINELKKKLIENDELPPAPYPPIYTRKYD